MNLTHVRAAFTKLVNVAEDARSAIEDKEDVADRDEDRIEAYSVFIDIISDAFSDLESELKNDNR